MRGGVFRSLGWVAVATVLLAGCGARTGVGSVEPRSDVDPVPPVPAVSETAPPSSAPPAPAPADELPRVTERRALLIGVNHAPGSPVLVGAVADALTTRHALMRYGYPDESITVLEDGAATRDAIIQAVGALATVGAGGQVVFMFAGHTRRSGGQNHLVTGDGRLLSASALARAMERIQAPMWASFPTCYAAGFAVPGIVGPGRVVTFASAAGSKSYEATSFGRSFLVEYMVNREMLAAFPGASVEEAYGRAEQSLMAEHPQWAPNIDDRHPGELLLGIPTPSWPDMTSTSDQVDVNEAPGPAASAAPSRKFDRPRSTPTPTPRSNSRVVACGPYVSAGSCRR